MSELVMRPAPLSLASASAEWAVRRTPRSSPRGPVR